MMKRLGDYIRPVDVRNRDLNVTRLLGVSITKEFMPSIANIVGTDLSAYKVVTKGQFAYGPVTSRNGDKISVALLDGYDDAIISQAYTVFEVVDTNALDPEYLMMWFRRPEFDRYARFHSHGSAREVFDWEEMCEVQVPVPAIEKQREIVAEYNTLATRIETNKKLIATLEQTAQTLYRHTFVDNIDPNNLPEGWRMGTLGDVCEYVKEKRSIDGLSEETYISTENMLKDRGGITICESLPEEGNVTAFEKDDVLISNIRPYFKKIWKATFSGGCSNDVLCFRKKDSFDALVLYYMLERDAFFEYVVAGCNGAKMPRGDKKWIMNYSIVIPSKESLQDFREQVEMIMNIINLKRQEFNKIESMQTLLLSKMGVKKDIQKFF